MVEINFKIGTEHTDTVKQIQSRKVRHCCGVQFIPHAKWVSIKEYTKDLIKLLKLSLIIEIRFKLVTDNTDTVKHIQSR